MGREVRVVAYDPAWATTFASIKETVTSALGPLAQRVEHVGSTSVPGLWAKPIVDIDVVIQSWASLPDTITALGSLGYVHQGDQGIKEREAFKSPAGAPSHNLYVCSADSRELKRHVTFRDYLRIHADAVSEYAELKKKLAEEFRHDIDGYCEAKTHFIEGILTKAGA